MDAAVVVNAPVVTLSVFGYSKSVTVPTGGYLPRSWPLQLLAPFYFSCVTLCHCVCMFVFVCVVVVVVVVRRSIEAFVFLPSLNYVYLYMLILQCVGHSRLCKWLLAPALPPLTFCSHR
jgi:hypothetical protein